MKPHGRMMLRAAVLCSIAGLAHGQAIPEGGDETSGRQKEEEPGPGGKLRNVLEQEQELEGGGNIFQGQGDRRVFDINEMRLRRDNFDQPFIRPDIIDPRRAGQPGLAPAAVEAIEGLAEGELVSFPQFSEPVALQALVELITQLLEISYIAPAEGIPGTIRFNAPREVPKSSLLPLLITVLEQQGFGLTFDNTSELYIIQRVGNLPRVFEGDLATTKVLEVPNIKPSTLADSINRVLGGGGAAADPRGGGGTAASGANITFVDQLGLIVMTGTTKQIERVESVLKVLRERYSSFTLTPIELRYLAASVARSRILAFVGASGGQGGSSAPPGAEGNIGAVVRAEASIDNLGERLLIDPQGNSLLFRGTSEELDVVLSYVNIVDRPIELQAREYFAGASASSVAQLAEARGLGEVISLSTQPGQSAGGLGGSVQPGGAGGAGAGRSGGPTLVVDTSTGKIFYYGTPDQQEALQTIVDQLDTESDRVVIRQYRLDNADAEEVAGIIQSLLTGQSPTGQASLLPQSRGAIGGGGFQPLEQQQRFRDEQIAREAGGEGEIGDFDPAQTFVVADPANNQIIVKAPRGQQEDFEELIGRLDRRRPQVFIEATIVSLSDSNALDIEVDTQFTLGEAEFTSNFGVTNPPELLTGTPTAPGNLGGLTIGIIQQNFLPFVLRTLQTKSDARIISRPQLLVNDNEEATIASVEEQPTTSTQTGNTSDITSFSGFEEAGTTLSVTPTIAESGFVSLEYSVEFSNFLGAGSGGVPPPRANQNVDGVVTIPSDATIVVGGITVNNVTNSKVTIPLLGDIPLVNLLFSDTSRTESDTLLYIFITPRVLTDPNFNDLKLLTNGPRDLAGIDPDAPPLRARFLELTGLPRSVGNPGEAESPPEILIPPAAGEEED